jgi:hypothetical protein
VCDETGCRDRAFADLVWQRGPGQWVTLSGEGAYGDLARVVTVGESLVDRPQPVNLQVGLAPAGWSVTDWHNGTDLSLRNDADPDQWLGVQCLPPFPSGSGVDNGSVDQRIESVTAIEPVISTTVGGRPARLVHAHDYMDVDMRFWLLAWELADGTLCTVHAPEEFTRDDVLAIAAQVTYRP